MASFNVTPNSIGLNSTGVMLTLAGTGTSWSGSPFTLSGVTGVTITAQNVTSATAATITVSAGSSQGVNVISDQQGNTMSLLVGYTLPTNNEGGNSGVGALQSVPAGSTNGTPLGTMPSNAVGARFYLGTSDSVTFTIAASQPTSAPTATYTLSGASGGTGPNWDENLNGQMIYVTASSGSPKFRWF